MTILANPDDFVRATLGTWQEQVKAAYRTAAELRRRLGWPVETGAIEEAERRFPTFVPEAFCRRMTMGDPRDPLLLQVMPVEAETTEGGDADPVQEWPLTRAPGVIVKYPGRALLIAAKACAVNCRYCFRREFPYEAAPSGRREWQASLQVIANDRSIQEVILSGGDPLLNGDEQLATMFADLNEIGHLRRIRIHTRLPVVIPDRITEGWLEIMKSSVYPVTVVLHINHPREIDSHLIEGARRLSAVPRLLLLNQSVLLRGVNDSVETLSELSWRLLEAGITPYYLHQLDRVRGSLHFEVPVEEGRRLWEGLRRSLPGYAVPRYVQEVPGDWGKSPLVGSSDS